MVFRKESASSGRTFSLIITLTFLISFVGIPLLASKAFAFPGSQLPDSSNRTDSAHDFQPFSRFTLEAAANTHQYNDGISTEDVLYDRILGSKWVARNLPRGFSGVLIADVTGDSREEVIHAGEGRITCLDGTTGSVIWRHFDQDIGYYCQPQMADLNKDGDLEIIVPLENPLNSPGCLALYGNDGRTYWRVKGLGGSTISSSPVVADIDGSGYPTIFIGSEDITAPLNGTLTALSSDGRVLRTTWVYRPCSGGFSVADTDGDGTFELFMGDRPGSGEYTGGQGAVAFNAHTLKKLWSRPDILCSSQCPMLADVNKDGRLDVIVENQRGGVYVLNSGDGSTIRGSKDVDMPGHYQPSIYDIDGDGNLEMILADGDHASTPNDVRVWDLVRWREDGRIDIQYCTYAPQVGEVTGDGFMDIIAANHSGIFIISYNRQLRRYELVDSIKGLSGWFTYAVVQDTDGDGLNEIVVSSTAGLVYAFDTPARRPNPRARSEVQFYSERRLGAAEYVSPPLPRTVQTQKDGFESGSFSWWSGTTFSPDEKGAVVDSLPHQGAYSARFTSDGDGGYEQANCYKNVTSSSELYARGYVYISNSGIADNGDKTYFITFHAGGNKVAFAGWKKIDGLIRWHLAVRDGTGYRTVYSSMSPSLGQWYSVELHWKKDATNGLGELWINGELAATITGRNTATYGDIDQASFGLAEIYSCGPTQIYCDDYVTSNAKIGP